MARIVGIAGSTRPGSTNRSLLQAAGQLAPPGTTVEIATIAGIPLFDADAEKAHGLLAEFIAGFARFAGGPG